MTFIVFLPIRGHPRLETRGPKLSRPLPILQHHSPFQVFKKGLFVQQHPLPGLSSVPLPCSYCSKVPLTRRLRRRLALEAGVGCQGVRALLLEAVGESFPPLPASGGACVPPVPAAVSLCLPAHRLPSYKGTDWIRLGPV